MFSVTQSRQTISGPPPGAHRDVLLGTPCGSLRTGASSQAHCRSIGGITPEPFRHSIPGHTARSSRGPAEREGKSLLTTEKPKLHSSIVGRSPHEVHVYTHSVFGTGPCNHGNMPRSFITVVDHRTHDLLGTIEHDGLDLAALPEEGLQLLVVEEAVGRHVLQLQNTARTHQSGAAEPRPSRCTPLAHTQLLSLTRCRLHGQLCLNAMT